MPIADAFAADVFNEDRSSCVPLKRKPTWKESLKNKLANRATEFSGDVSQQRLAGSAPDPNPLLVITVVFATGILFIPLGCVFLRSSNGVREFKYEYHHETSNTTETMFEFDLEEDFPGKVVLYYEIDNFFQAHRLHFQGSLPRQQMIAGNLKDIAGCTGLGQIEEMRKVHEGRVPCGYAFKPMFYDHFTLTRLDSAETIAINRNDSELLHPADRVLQGPKLPEGKTLCEYFEELKLNSSDGPYKFCEHGFNYPPFVIWLKSAAFNSFRKPYAFVRTKGNKGLMKGRYKMEIKRNFEAAKRLPNIRIRFVLSTLSWMGGKNSFLGRIYIAVGILYILVGILIVFIYAKFRIPSQQFRDFNE